MFTSSHKQSKYISISHDYHEQWYPHDGSRCYFVKFAKKVFRLKERATYTTQQTELVLMRLQSLNYHIQCLEYLELNSFLFHEEFFFFSNAR